MTPDAGGATGLLMPPSETPGPPAATRGPVPVGTRPRDRRTRWRGRLLLTAGLALASLLAGGVVTAPALVSLAPIAPAFRGDATVTTVPEYGPRGTHIVGYRHGARLTMELPVRNTGPLPITVAGVSTGVSQLPLLTVTAVDGLPVTLGPGQTGRVVLEAELGNCKYYSEREWQIIDGLQLTVRTLGRAADRIVPLDRPLLVPSPMIVGCPDRKLNRQQDIRGNPL